MPDNDRACIAFWIQPRLDGHRFNLSSSCWMLSAFTGSFLKLYMPVFAALAGCVHVVNSAHSLNSCCPPHSPSPNLCGRTVISSDIAIRVAGSLRRLFFLLLWAASKTIYTNPAAAVGEPKRGVPMSVFLPSTTLVYSFTIAMHRSAMFEHGLVVHFYLRDRKTVMKYKKDGAGGWSCGWLH